MKVFFIRHGRTDANIRGVYAGGRTDVCVNEGGKAEARRIAGSADFRALFRDAFGGRPVTPVYTSPMIRARETAGILFPEAALQTVEDFREFVFGEFEGRVYDDLKDDPAYIEWTRGDDDSRCPPDGDSINTCTERVCRAFSEIARGRFARGDQTPIVIVAHGGTAMAFLRGFIDRTRPFFTWDTPNCGIWRFDCAQGKDGGLKLTLLGEPPQ